MREKISPVAAENQPTVDESTIRQTTTGPIVGFSDVTSGTHSWLGIPYAKPPTGELRWKAPQPMEAWQHVKKALHAGCICTQVKPIWKDSVVASDTFMGVTYAGSEDCLYLNIWSPSSNSITRETDISSKNSRLPVMVWIHGGGNIWGSGNLDGCKLAGSQNVILVSMNYRLGPFGWLSNPALRDSTTTPEDNSGNFGTLDIIQALQWIKDNISAFGGNPDRVTIFGASAGGWNVYSLLVSPKAKGLFHRAIVQSGVPKMASREKAENFIDDPIPGHPQSSGELLLQLLQNDAGVTDRFWAKTRLHQMNTQSIADYLHSKTYEELEEAYSIIAQANATQYFAHEEINDTKLSETNFIPKSNHSVPKLFNDGFILSKDGFHASVSKGNYNAVPMILGTGRDESKCFQLLDSEFVTVVDGKRIIKDLYRYNLTNEYVSKLWKVSGVDEPATSITENKKSLLFSYRIDWDDLPIIEGENLAQLYGAAHVMEMYFLFSNGKIPMTDQPTTSEFDDLSDKIMSYWAEFAYSGNPRCGRDGQLPQWEPWNNNIRDNNTLILDTISDGGIHMSNEYANKQGILKQISNDERLRNLKDRCQLYQDILNHSHTFLTLREYNALEDGLCARNYPCI